MDVVQLSQNTLRIKGKNASIVVNPTTSISKTEADAILLLSSYVDQSFAKIEGSRITLQGPGEYEVSGVKISTTRVNEELVASIELDGLKLLVGSGTSIEQIHDKIEGCEIGVINADNNFNYSVITSLEPRVLIVYGPKKEEAVKSLGKDTPIVSSKYSTTAEKLPEEMEVILLG